MSGISVVIPVWNNADTLPACLESLHNQVLLPYEIYLVDNGSTDQGVQKAFRRWPGVEIIKNSTNKGFAAACNQGIGSSCGDFVLLLNADAWLHPSFLKRATESIEHRPDVGSVTGKVYRGVPPTIDSTGIILGKKKFSPRDRGEGEIDHGQYETEEYIFGPSGAAALYRRKALDECKIGEEILDEDFFAYYEDVDLAWRLQLFGWRSLYVPQAIAFHDRKGPEKKDTAICVRAYANRYLCYVKNEILSCVPSYLPFGLPYEIGRFAWLCLRRPYMVFSAGSFFTRLSGALRKRKEIQSRKRVSDGYMAQFE